MPAVLIADSLSEEGREIFAKVGGMTVDYRPDITPDELKAVVGNYEGLVVRSRARVTADTLERVGRLRVIGRAGVGLDNVDVPAATAKGVIVMNTPGGNTISTAENTMSLLLSLSRNVAKADASMRAGRWDKNALGGVELLDKTLAVIGLGRIGLEVAKRAAAFGMKIIGYDPFTPREVAARHGVQIVALDEIWSRADFITVHTPLNDETQGMIGAAQLAQMKPTCRLVNCARGGIIDEAALVEALEKKVIAGAALDVFETEPLPQDHPLRRLDNVVLTPHLSASTAEAQEKVAVQIAEQIVDVLTGKAPRNAVNAPSIDPEVLEAMRPYLDLAERMGSFLAQYVSARITRLTNSYSGSVLDHPTDPITTAVLIGFLSRRVNPDEVNYVNAPFLMKDRGVEVIEAKSSELHGYANLITVEVLTRDGARVSLSATLFTRGNPRLVSLNDRHFDARPEGAIIVIQNKDVPGIIGAVGTLLGARGINIAHMTWGRDNAGGDAITLLNCDQDVTPEILSALEKLEYVRSARLIRL
jgi:D-3-phosphoglycerate dehydrogenase